MKRIMGAILCVLLLARPAAALGQTPPGESAVLMDAATGTVLYEHNGRRPLPPASVTKVMTMLLIMEAIDGGVIGWEDPVTVSESAAAKGGSQIYLKVGEQMSVRDMLKSITVSSANDCACAMAEHLAGSEQAFAEKMNKRAGELGMQDTHFVNCTGLDDGEEARDHRTSALDIAIMSRELLVNHPDIKKFTTIWMDAVRNGAFGLSNTNKLVRFYPGCTGLKTGFTSGAGFCLSASALREGMELIAVVMGCKTSSERFDACRKLLDQGFAAYALVQPMPDAIPEVPVELGKAQRVQVIPARTPQILIEKSQRGTVTTRLELEPQVTAPVSRGQKLGMLTVLSGEQVLEQIPLTAAEAVERLGWGELFERLLRRVAMA